MTPAEIADQLCELIASETKGMDTVATRIVANRIAKVIDPWLPDTTVSLAPEVTPMTDMEARAYAVDRMEFGKYNGKLIGEIPLDYLEWVADAGRRTWRQIHAYLNNPRIKAEREDQP